MGLKNFVKKTVKTNTNVKGWVDWDTIKNNASIIGTYYRDIKTANRGNNVSQTVTHSFDDLVKQYGFTENDLKKRMRSHLLIAAFSVVLALAALGWTGYLLTKGMVLSSLVSISLSVLMFVYAFREHFFYFKIKQRRLNCTVNEWFSSLVPFKRT